MLEKLEDEGIYIWLDLEVQRGLKRGDEIQNFEEISRGNPATNLKGCNYVNVIIQKAMQHFNEAYVAILTALLDCVTKMIRPSSY